MSLLRPSAAVALALSLLASVPLARAGLRDPNPGPAAVTTRLAASTKEVHAALLQALSTWKLRKESLSEGIVKTEWVPRPSGDQMYRGRIVAEFSADGYETVLSVKHEKERQAKDLVTTMGGPQASWQAVSGDFQIAQDVLLSVEKALGQEPDPVQIGVKPPTSSRPIEVWDCIVTPVAANRINELKSRRRDLVTEVKAMDQEILKAVYDGTYEQLKPDIEKTKQRKAMMEQQITEIDKEILTLVVAD